ncbi:MAG TPA: acetyl-CoA carboxylase biotin carboxylase subunit [Acidobacteriota bacterium]|nr:acetyl-CoA carboxylase biotin carboxylase subunit [Acidobacteriota bacterium]HQM61723.1 acetyl-CoA carboxylase biotin carboxylase subunit [Acidobacteriota bacterium]
MFRKVLIANRGEIAVRVITACRELGIETVAVYSDADVDALHVRLADEKVCIGPARSDRSYLNIPAIISAAEITNVDAIHPGYGFLAENARFAEICESCNIKFVGPPAPAIALMGDKAAARRRMAEAGLPIVSGSDGLLPDASAARRLADTIGYPVILKATAGGGGKGMRIVRSADELGNMFALASGEAGAAFGNAGLYVEKYIENPRHIEFQILADRFNHVIHAGERECSVQRRHQKLIEEAPSPLLRADQRRTIGEQVTRAIAAVGYESAGTVEFIVDAAGCFYFMEMNTRIQVEHPVTEMISGLDLIQQQLRIAAGEPLGLAQRRIRFSGHSIECRINAEDPRSFRPCPGLITGWCPPGGPGVRIDTFVSAGYRILPYYDSLIAKLIVWGHDRQEARVRMLRALEQFVVEGVQTTIPLLQRVLRDDDFVRGEYDTHFLERLLPRWA